MQEDADETDHRVASQDRPGARTQQQRLRFYDERSDHWSVVTRWMGAFSLDVAIDWSESVGVGETKG
jgi:hypothetical protein